MHVPQLFHDALVARAKNAARAPGIQGALDAETCRILQEAHLIYVNAAVVDSLALITPAQTDYDVLGRLPLPSMFFELSAPLALSLPELRRTRAVLFGPARDVSSSARLSYGIASDDGRRSIDDCLAAIAFSETDSTEIVFSPNDAYEFQGGTASISAYGVRTGIRKDADHAGDASFVRDLCCNLVHYINAHNITLRQVDRSSPDVARKNRKRATKGKRPIDPLKPYHWIEIREHEYSRHSHAGEGASLEYRELVRGHFQRFHTSEGVVRNWIDPYVRGPDGAPWKENRYLLLADLLSSGSRPLA